MIGLKREMEDLHRKLCGGLFLSSMLNLTNGKFCAERSQGCSMVQLVAYLAEPPAYGREPWILPPTRKDCVEFLAEECRQARNRADIFVCLNLATPRLEWGLKAAEFFSEAGGGEALTEDTDPVAVLCKLAEQAMRRLRADFKVRVDVDDRKFPLVLTITVDEDEKKWEAEKK